MRTVSIIRTAGLAAALLAGSAGAAAAQAGDPLTRPYPPEECRSCAGWSVPQAPARIYGNTYYVGTRELSAVLITSPEGHVLLDGALPNAAPLILDNVRALGFDVRDIRLILNSHAHFDHAGGIAALQRASGARVAASASSTAVLERGATGPDDPQDDVHLDYPAVPRVERFAFGDTLRVGDVALVPHATGGHTPGGTTWTWTSCGDAGCLQMVYADSHSPISADGFLFSDNDVYPTAIADFERGFATLESLRCDILITPHPGGSALWDRLAGDREGLIDPQACTRYAATGRAWLARRLREERGTR